MAASHPHGHNGGGLSPEEQRKLWDHVRAMEVLQEQIDEIKLDVNARKQLAKADGFDTNILGTILKRRKVGEGETRAADSLVRMYEDGLREQGALPLERTKGAATAPRKPLEDIAQELHGQPLPEMPERPDLVMYERAKELTIKTQKASTSQLQRVLEIGFAAAVRHIEHMEQDGIVSAADQVGVRRVLVPAPEGDSVVEAVQELHDLLRRDGATMTMRVEGQPDVTFGGGMFADDPADPADPF